MTTQTNTAWIWRDEATMQVMGASYDPKKDVLQWYDEPGCACTGSHAQQNLADFLTNGASMLNPPDEILTEMRADLQAFITTEKD